MCDANPEGCALRLIVTEQAGGVRQLWRLPPGRWLRAQPRCVGAAVGAMAGPDPRTTPRLSAPLPGLGERTGEQLRIEQALTLVNEKPLPGLRLELAEIWNC